MPCSRHLSFSLCITRFGSRPFLSSLSLLSISIILRTLAILVTTISSPIRVLLPRPPITAFIPAKTTSLVVMMVVLFFFLLPPTNFPCLNTRGRGLRRSIWRRVWTVTLICASSLQLPSSLKGAFIGLILTWLSRLFSHTSAVETVAGMAA